MLYHCSNGLAFSPDYTTAYLADTGTRTVWAYDYHEDSGGFSGKRVFLQMPPEGHMDYIGKVSADISEMEGGVHLVVRG